MYLDILIFASYNTNRCSNIEQGVIWVSQYIIVDQKSYYAVVECVARGLDPMNTNLVVADPERSSNLCLAVSPSMKALGVKNRCRIKDIPPHIKYIVAPPRMQMYIDCAAEIHGAPMTALANY